MRMLRGLERGATQHMAVCTTPHQSYITTTWFPYIPLAISPLRIAESRGCICIDAWGPWGVAPPAFPSGEDTCVNFVVQTHMCVSRVRHSPKSRVRGRSPLYVGGFVRKDRFLSFFSPLSSIRYFIRYLCRSVEINSNWYIYPDDKLCMYDNESISNVRL